MTNQDERLKAQLEAGCKDLTNLTPANPLLVGNSPRMQMIHEYIDRVAPSQMTILLTGETGTGKEVVAHLLHERSRRKEKRFVKFSCAAIPEPLAESELFGHEKGAFTGADKQRIGYFEEANGGTIFLDEIGETTLVIQAKLLRVLEQREVIRIGGNNHISVDVRIVAATNRDLQTEIWAGHFRRDLYYRLAGFTLHLPPLKERSEDIPELVGYFLEKLKGSADRPKRLVTGVMEALMAHDWPGNVRELESCITRGCTLAPGQEVELRHVFPPKDDKTGTPQRARNAPAHLAEIGPTRRKAPTPDASQLKSFFLTVKERLPADSLGGALSCLLGAAYTAALIELKGKRELAQWLERGLKKAPAAWKDFNDLPHAALALLLAVTDGRGGRVLRPLDGPHSVPAQYCDDPRASVVNFGMSKALTQGIHQLVQRRGLRGIHAVDVVGPPAWRSPVTYCYIAPQLRAYAERYGNPNACDYVRRARDRALGNAVRSGLKPSLSPDDPRGSGADRPGAFAMSRLLLWTRKELWSPEGEYVIAIHAAFDVPLFFLNVGENEPRRSTDFIVFLSGTEDDGEYRVYFGKRESAFGTLFLDNQPIDGQKDPEVAYQDLLEAPDLLLAADARRLNEAEP